jgi:hypothetical protein
LQGASDANWPSTNVTSDRELKHLANYVPRFKDTLFKARIEEATREYLVHRYGKGESVSLDTYETDVLAIRHVPHFAERRYGIHFKDTDEFGLYGVFLCRRPRKAI